ncbi:DUF6300 family protein [Streptomyces sp. NPDC005706]|uniref:DUF6300 family protein n=1 Tax=Streptomyces sp. NPDC005706 TaxID=3157169 RepID=UPI0033E9580A
MRIQLAGLPKCSRCRGDLLMSAIAPVDDAYGRPIHLELCASCDTGDTGRPAADRLARFYTDGHLKDTTRNTEAARLLKEWTQECMAAHGWYLRPKPPDRP